MPKWSGKWLGGRTYTANDGSTRWIIRKTVAEVEKYLESDAPAPNAHPLPDGVGFEPAAALPVAGARRGHVSTAYTASAALSHGRNSASASSRSSMAAWV